MDIREFDSWDDTADLRALITVYVNWLNVDLCFQQIDAELADLSSVYAPSAGGSLLIASEDDELVGCVGLKKLGAGVCEMKRLYVKPAFQGHGVGRELVEGIIQKACGRGCQEVKLDVLPKSTVALKIYERMGFKPITPYDADPHHAMFLGLELSSKGSDQANGTCSCSSISTR